MALAITEEHRALADVARSLAQALKLRRATRAAWDDPAAGPGDAWKAIAGQGWTGLAVPEEYGGSGYGLPELAVVVEQLGANLVPGPFVSTAAAAAVLAALAPEQVRREFLPGLADGSLIGAVDTGSRPRAANTPANPVPGAAWAQVLIVRDGADLLVVRAQDASVEPVTGADPSLGMARVSADGGTRLPGAAAAGLRLVRAIVAAEAAGGARQALEDALAYAKVREQFGRIIGGFQAVKHHLATMLVEAECATAAAWDAARAATAQGPEGEIGRAHV